MERDNLFLEAVKLELGRARQKFPSPDGLLAALSEEAGEVAKAVLSRPWDEAVQTAAMACRLAVEGNPTLAAYRQKYIVEGG